MHKNVNEILLRPRQQFEWAAASVGRAIGWFGALVTAPSAVVVAVWALV